LPTLQAKASRAAADRLQDRLSGALQSDASLLADHYKLLGLGRQCSEGDVKRAYKKLALQMHPDKAVASCKFSTQAGPGGAKLAAELVSEAQARVAEDATWIFKCLGKIYILFSYRFLSSSSRFAVYAYLFCIQHVHGAFRPPYFPPILMFRPLTLFCRRGERRSHRPL
jgi:hypothetical protein